MLEMFKLLANKKYLIISTILLFTLSFSIHYLGTKQVIPWNIAYYDIGPWAKQAFEPGLPYVDKVVEYPVIIGMMMHLATQFGTKGYLLLHYILLFICAIISTYYLYKLCNLFGKSKKNIFIFWIFTPTFLWFSFYNWDIIAVMFSILALYNYQRKNDITASIFLGLGVATKMYPILILFPVLLHRDIKGWVKNGIAFAASFLFVNAYFMISRFAGWYATYGFHSKRMPNIDSIWWLLMQLFPELKVRTVNLVTLILFALVYILLNARFRRLNPVFLSMNSILAFLIINKVFSPQFLLWVLPFFALYPIRLKEFYALEASNLLVLFFTLTHIFSKMDITIWLYLSGIFVILRHILLIMILTKNVRHAKALLKSSS